MINARLNTDTITSNEAEAFSLYEKSNFGEKTGEKILFTGVETLFLQEEEKMNVFSNKKLLSNEELIKKLKKHDKRIELKYLVFRDLRKRGYVIKTALKFGADFRVYSKGARPGEEHAKWLVFAVKENSPLIWQEFAAKNRIAHGTKKNLLIGIVDEESDITYYEISWLKP